MWKRTCLIDVGVKTGECSKKSFMSPLQIFPLVGLTSIKDATQEEINKSFQMAMQQPQIWGVYSSLFDTSVTPGTNYVKFMRAIFNLAGPLEYNGIRYSDKADRR
jgi:hypothetical protein